MSTEIFTDAVGVGKCWTRNLKETMFERYKSRSSLNEKDANVRIINRISIYWFLVPSRQANDFGKNGLSLVMYQEVTPIIATRLSPYPFKPNLARAYF
jgi:hypothetical protein